MIDFLGRHPNIVASVFLLLFLTEQASPESFSAGCGCDFKHYLCDLTASCEHGIWTTAHKFDSMTNTIKYGFCDCETGWSGNLCEYPSGEHEAPETACSKNYGVWNGDFCRCSKGTFGRYCQFRLISMLEGKQKCVCGQQRSFVIEDEYVCQNDTSLQHPDFIRKIRVLANAQPVIIHPEETDNQKAPLLVTTSIMATNNERSPARDQPTTSALFTESGEERNIVEQYESATKSSISAWIPICIALILIIITLCVIFIAKNKFYNKRSHSRPTISHPIGLTPAQLTTAISTTTAAQTKESPPPSYESLELK